MKQSIKAFIALGPLVLLLSGCINPPMAEFAPPEGFLFSAYKAPLIVDFDDAKVSNRYGNADSMAFQDILITGMSFAWGDCSLNTAVENGRLSKVGTADYEYLGILRIFGKTTVHAYQAPAVASKK